MHRPITGWWRLLSRKRRIDLRVYERMGRSSEAPMGEDVSPSFALSGRGLGGSLLDGFIGNASNAPSVGVPTLGTPADLPEKLK